MKNVQASTPQKVRAVRQVTLVNGQDNSEPPAHIIHKPKPVETPQSKPVIKEATNAESLDTAEPNIPLGSPNKFVITPDYIQQSK